MTTGKAHSLGAYVLMSASVLLAISITIASLSYVRPLNCQRFCADPESVPCPPGACRNGEQRSGFPLPVFIDNGGGSSPTGGWGKLGPEDLPNPLAFIIDVLFYSALFWLAWRLIANIGGKEQPWDLRSKLKIVAGEFFPLDEE
jgi:hypothetical protein